MKTPSFNTWLSMQKSHEDILIRSLADMWKPVRGRLTEKSVEKRSQTEYGRPPFVGMRAYREYRAAVAPTMTDMMTTPESTEFTAEPSFVDGTTV